MKLFIQLLSNNPRKLWGIRFKMKALHILQAKQLNIKSRLMFMLGRFFWFLLFRETNSWKGETECMMLTCYLTILNVINAFGLIWWKDKLVKLWRQVAWGVACLLPGRRGLKKINQTQRFVFLSLAPNKRNQKWIWLFRRKIKRSSSCK